MTKIQEYSFNDSWVQDMLWKYLNPSDLHWTCNKLSAIKLVESAWNLGECFFLGCKASDFLVRICIRNPFMIEPHIMGNGLYIREGLRQAVPLVFSRGIQSIVLYTQYPAIARITEKMGFTKIGVIPRAHFQGGELLDCTVLSLTKDNYVDQTISALDGRI